MAMAVEGPARAIASNKRDCWARGGVVVVGVDFLIQGGQRRKPIEPPNDSPAVSCVRELSEWKGLCVPGC